jgi:Glyoxalase/Bleomycin resistance protein/Dioxygenase superfamily
LKVSQDHYIMPAGLAPVRVDVSWVGEGKMKHRKACAMVRQDLEADSPYVELSNKPKPLTRPAAAMAAHFSLTVPDIKAAYQLTLDRGMTKDRKEPRFGRDERWQFNLFDPDGTRVECMQPKARSDSH